MKLQFEDFPGFVGPWLSDISDYYELRFSLRTPDTGRIYFLSVFPAFIDTKTHYDLLNNCIKEMLENIFQYLYEHHGQGD